MSAAPEVAAVFGGSFNPPHVAHVLATVYALSVSGVDRVIVVPVFRHPFAKALAPYEDRVQMAELAMGWLPRVSVSTIERELGGDSYTLRTVEALAARHPELRLRLLVGADVLADLPRWHRFERIAELAPPLVMGRGGLGAAAPEGVPEGLTPTAAVLPAVSSTEVRRQLSEGRPEAVRDLVPASVLRYIEERGLYRGEGGSVPPAHTIVEEAP